MIPEISAALSSAKAALGLANSIRKISNDVELNQVVIELQQSILNLQGEMMAAQEQVDRTARRSAELEAKIAEKAAWETEKQRYALKELASGIFVYAPKAGAEGGEPNHYLCPTCFQSNFKSILQRPSPTVQAYICHACKLEIRPVPKTFSAEAIRVRRGLSDGFMV